MEPVVYDAAGHRRSPATMPGYHLGRPPRNKGLSYPADPPTVEEIVTVMRAAGDGPDGARLRTLIVILWRAGLRVGEALDLAETDLDAARGAVLVRHGKGGRRREVGMDRWAWQQLQAWLEIRARLPVGPLLCVIHGLTAGRHWEHPQAASTHGSGRRRAPPLCAAPAPSRSRGRDGSRGSAVGRYPAPARARPPRHHLDLPPRNRQLRDHRHRPLALSTCHFSERRSPHWPVDDSSPRTGGPRSRPAALHPRIGRALIGSDEMLVCDECRSADTARPGSCLCSGGDLGSSSAFVRLSDARRRSTPLPSIAGGLFARCQAGVVADWSWLRGASLRLRCWGWLWRRAGRRSRRGHSRDRVRSWRRR